MHKACMERWTEEREEKGLGDKRGMKEDGARLKMVAAEVKIFITLLIVDVDVDVDERGSREAKFSLCACALTGAYWNR